MVIEIDGEIFFKDEHVNETAMENHSPLVTATLCGFARKDGVRRLMGRPSNNWTARLLDRAPLFRLHIVEHAGRRTGDFAATQIDVLVALENLSSHAVQREIEKPAVR